MVEKKKGHRIQEGPMLVYYSTSGKLMNRMFFVNGELHGEFQYWDEGGNLRAQGLYFEGRKHGVWSYWDSDGKPVKQEKFNNGVLVDTRERKNERKNGERKNGHP
jgi:antitoxin component YwqK of YwqJK toxin-antitoxin module